MDLTAEMKQYSFQLKDPAPYASAYMFCYDEANDYWQSCDLQTRYHEESGLLNCVLTNDYDLQLSENASQLCFVIYTEDHLYLYVVNNRQRIAYDTIMLSDEGMNKVEFTPADAGVQVNGVDIEIFGYTVPLHASTIYVPEGNYEMTVRCLHGDDEYISKQLDVEVSGDQQVDVGFDLTGVPCQLAGSMGNRRRTDPHQQRRRQLQPLRLHPQHPYIRGKRIIRHEPFALWRYILFFPPAHLRKGSGSRYRHPRQLQRRAGKQQLDRYIHWL